jgi:hypothetical protein
MKAKVLYTGKIVEVKLNLNSQPTANSGAKSVYEGSDGNTYFDTELDFKNVYPDWQQIRIQSAIAILQGIYSSKDIALHASKTTYNPLESMAELATKQADVLVSELQKSMEL